nr:MAG TPA: hypothetical protein [Caudoviricetes sp.]
MTNCLVIFKQMYKTTPCLVVIQIVKNNIFFHAIHCVC